MMVYRWKIRISGTGTVLTLDYTSTMNPKCSLLFTDSAMINNKCLNASKTTAFIGTQVREHDRSSTWYNAFLHTHQLLCVRQSWPTSIAKKPLSALWWRWLCIAQERFENIIIVGYNKTWMREREANFTPINSNFDKSFGGRTPPIYVQSYSSMFGF